MITNNDRMDIHINTIRYTVALALHLNFHKAAEACHTSQPNLSAQIKKAEKELGFKIFERTNKFVRLTFEGRRVISEFRDILDRLQSLQDECNDPESGPITIGLFPTLAPYLLPQLIKHLKKTVPKLKITIVEDKTDRICDQLDEGHLDCIFAAHPVEHQGFEHDILFDDPFYLGISVENPLSDHDKIKFSDLRNENLMLLEEGHCLRGQALEICKNKHLPVNLNYHASSLETLRAMVAINSGVTFIPKMCLDHNPLISYRLLDDEQFSRSIAVFWRKSNRDNKRIQLLLNALKKLYPH